MITKVEFIFSEPYEKTCGVHNYEMNKVIFYISEIEKIWRPIERNVLDYLSKKLDLS